MSTSMCVCVCVLKCFRVILYKLYQRDDGHPTEDQTVSNASNDRA